MFTQMNIVSLIYLFFRLAPFIIVSYFTLQSVFNQDLKGVIYLVGLLIASVVTILVGNVLPRTGNSETESTPLTTAKCHMLTLNESGPISKLPLSQTVFGYTLAYLSYFIGVNNLQTQNIATFIIFPIIVIADFIWSTSNNCASPEMLLTALIVGGLIGVAWAMIIDSTNIANLAYFSGISNKDVCSQPSRSMYKCRAVKKTASSKTK
jgi:hypothetical protein